MKDRLQREERSNLLLRWSRLFRRLTAGLCILLLLVLSSCYTKRLPDTGSSAAQPSDSVCLDAQRAAFPGLVQGWREMASATPVELDDAQTVGRQPWTNALVTARSAVVRARCPDPPRELLGVIAFTANLDRDRDAMTMEQASSLGRLLRDLGTTLQVSTLGFDQRLLDLPVTCPEIRPQVSATYSLRSVATRTGRDLWVVLTVRNASSRGVYASVSGHLVAGPVKEGPGRASWQSKSTVVYANPLRTTQHPLLAASGERLHLTSHGKAISVALTVSLGFSAGPSACPVPARSTDSSVVVVAAGDIACGPNSPGYNQGRGVPGRCHQSATAELVETTKPDAVFALGDLQYPAGTAGAFLAGYDRSWGRFKQITYPVPGNHEYGGDPGASGYFGYFGQRATPRDPECTTSCRGYYSFDLGAWHVVALNSNCDVLPHGDGCSRGSAQNRWLERDLKAANKTTGCTVVLSHDPRWSSSSGAGSPELDPLVETMYDNGVDLLISGDAHTYERFVGQTPAGSVDEKTGITQIIVGTGGAHFTGLHTPGPNSLVAKPQVFGVLRLTLQTAGYKWKYLSDPSTPFKDSGRTACH